MSRSRAIDLGAISTFLLACVICDGGLRTERPWGDVGQYERYARLIVEGKVPYHDFYLEYPPGALAAFVPPALVTHGHYLWVFKALMTLVGVAGIMLVATILTRLGAGPARRALSLGVIALSPLMLGHVFLNRFDLFPAVLAVAALATLISGRPLATGMLMGAGFAVKVFAAAAAPVAAIHLSRTPNRSGLWRALAGAALVGLAIFVPFLAIALGGLGNTYWTQASRGLQIESLGASLLLAADRVGLLHVQSTIDSPGSIDLGGSTASTVAQVTTVVQVVVLFGVGLLYYRLPDNAQRVVTATAASLTAFVVFGKVLSPQFLAWLLFVVPLAGGRRLPAILATYATAMVLTQIELHGYVGLEIDTWAVWVVLLRNLLLVALFGLLLASMREGEDEPPRASTT